MASMRMMCLATVVLTAAWAIMTAVPAGAVDCQSLILNMADCLSFVTNGSTVAKPEGTCCSGLKTVIRSGPECLCEAFKSSASMGVSLNVTKSATLPSVCKVAAPPSARCGISASPPASAPGASPTAAAGAPQEESAGPDAGAPVPAISPGSSSPSSGSNLLSVSVVSFISGLLVVFFSCF